MDILCDQYNGDPTLTRLIAALEDRPEALYAVKHANFDPESADKLPSSAFAWDGERRYPIHTRADTIASLAYRSKYAGAVPAFVDQRLAEAAQAYNIGPEIFISEKQIIKAAAAPVMYALPDQQRLPLDGAPQIKVASEVLLRDGHTLPFEVQVEAFTKVAAAAVAQGMPLDNSVRTYAGLNSCNTQLLCDRVGMRVVTTKVAAIADAFDTLETALRQLPPVVQDRDTLVKLASRISELDRVAGLERQYGKKIFDPMQTVFNSGDKLAADNVERLMALPEDVWNQVDAPEMAAIAAKGDPEEFRRVYNTLPMDIRIVLDKQL